MSRRSQQLGLVALLLGLAAVATGPVAAANPATSGTSATADASGLTSGTTPPAPGTPAAVDSAVTSAVNSAATSAVNSAVTGRAGPVVLVGVDGAAWAAVDVALGSPATGPVGTGPAGPFSDLAARGSVASLSVRTGDPTTCPVDGWLTVSAGRRAVGPDRGPGGVCPAVPGVVIDPTSVPIVPDVSGEPDPRSAGRVTGWAALRDRNAGSPFAAVVGTLSDAVSGARSCVTAVGPGAALAAAGPAGDVDSFVADPRRITREVLTGCAMTIVDAGSSVAAAAPVLARVASLLPTGSTLLVVGVDDAAVGAAGTGQLRLAAATGPAFPGSDGIAAGPGSGAFGVSSGAAGTGGRLTAASTRWPGLVQLTDVAPTLLTAAGVTARPPTFVGSSWTATSAQSPVATVAGLRTDGVRARVAQDAIRVFYTAFGVAAGVLVLVCLALGRWSPARRGSRLLRGWGLVVAALPVSTRLASLVPWWSSGRPGLALAGAVTGWAVVVAGAAVVAGWATGGRRPGLGDERGPGNGRGPGEERAPGAWRRAAVIVAALTVAVVAVDLAAGSSLQKLTVVGLTPVEGGRFYGMGNELFAATGICALVCVAGLATRWPGRSLRWCAAVGVGFVALDGLPGLGADFGGVPAAVVGFGLTGLALSPVRPRAGRLLAVAGAAVAVALLALLADLSLAPGSRTQVGAFAADVLAGGGGDVVSRKAAAAADPFLYRIDSPVGSTGAWVGLAALVLMAAVVVRPSLGGGTAFSRLLSGWPQLRAVLLGAVGLGLVGGLLNDSGIAVPTIVAEVGAGLVIALLPSAHGADDEAATPGPSSGVADRTGDGPGTEPAPVGDRQGQPEHAPTRSSPPDDWESI